MSWQDERVREGKMEIEDLTDRDIDTCPIENLSPIADRLGISRRHYGDGQPLDAVRAFVKAAIRERR